MTAPPSMDPHFLADVPSDIQDLLMAEVAGGTGRLFPRQVVGGPLLPTLAWGRMFLAPHFSKPPSVLHRWLGEQLDRMRGARGEKLNVIGPRGSAKSTIATLCYVLRVALENRERYIWIVSDTRHQAQTHLENVKVELTTNELLLRHYSGTAGRGPRWQAASIELPGGVVIESFGTGQRIRGRRRRADRPTLIVCDDLQNDSHIASAWQREQSRQWFHGTLLKAGTKRTNIINLATALHRDALAMELLRTPGWVSGLFRAIQSWPKRMDLWVQWEELYTRGACSAAGEVERHAGDDLRFDSVPALSSEQLAHKFYEQNRVAMDEGASLLWPEEEDLYTLMKMRAQSGHTAFEREKQSSPFNPEMCEWPEEYFADHIWFERWPARLQIKTIALDPSKGSDARRGDYSALVMLGIDAAGILFVEADLARRPTSDIAAVAAEWCVQFRPMDFGVEANQFQELLAGELADEFRRRSLFLHPTAIHNHTSKQVRIRRIGPFLAQRRLRFRSRSPSTRLLVDQLRDFPQAAHDDGPDALEMAIRLAEEISFGRAANDGLGDRLRVG